MAEQGSPRVALVYGDAAQIVHVREALSGQAEIVVETGGADFDVAQLAAVQAQVVLVNLDGSDGLGDVAARLDETGIRTVFNDPEISRKLEGWDQARWRRHLVAKLRGSTDFDPPRPAFGVAALDATVGTITTAADATLPAESAVDVAAPATVGAAAPDAKPEPAPEFVPVAVQPNALERPLSLAEIESMSASFGAVDSESVIAADTAAPAPDTTMVVEPTSTAGSASAASAALDTAAAEAAEPETAAEPELDVDTAALSAMIDARLAETEPAPATPPAVWRMVEDDVAPAAAPLAAEAASDVAEAAPPVAPAAPRAAARDKVDVLQGMPALGDWQLVDPNEPIAPVAKSQRESPQVPAGALDFAGLELVPMETIVPVELRADPVERWMGVKEHGKSAAALKSAAPAAAPERPDGDRA